MTGDQRRSLVARGILRIRAARPGIFPKEIFSEHAWDILLSLFVALAANETLSELEVMRRVHVDVAIGSRWITHLTSVGLIAQDSAKQDLTLTLDGAAGMRSFLDQAASLGMPVGSSDQ